MYNIHKSDHKCSPLSASCSKAKKGVKLTRVQKGNPFQTNEIFYKATYNKSGWFIVYRWVSG